MDDACVLATKWADASVGQPEIQKFVGALAGKQASKGIFITTSRYTDEARESAQRLRERVILVDGLRLAELMIEFNVGALSAAAFELKKIDLDFFNDSRRCLQIERLSLNLQRRGAHMLRRYCPPTSKRAPVIWPSEHTRTASISTSNTFRFSMTAC